MAIVRDFCGFETGDLAAWTSGGTFGAVADGSARSGEFHGRWQQPVGVSGFNGLVGRLMTPGIPTPGAGEVGRVLLRGYIRVRQYPNANNMLVLGIGSSGTRHMGLTITTAGVLGLFHISGATSTGPVIPLDVWHRVEVSYKVTEDGGTPYPTECQVSVSGPAISWAAGNTSQTAASLSLFELVFCHTGGTFTNAIIEVDDLLVVFATAADAAAVALPVASRIHALRPTAQGASAAWTGDWRHVRKRPKGNSTSAQTTSTNNARTTFTHLSAEALGLDTVPLA